MNNFDFDEWDPDFIEKVFQEEEKLSTQRRLTSPPLQSLPPPLLQSLPPPQPLPQLGYSHENPTTSHSPPRILSQRTTDYRNIPLSHTSSGNVTPIPHVCISRNANEVEIDRLKKELGHVKNQLTNLEQECLELREERDKKEEQLKSVFSQIETREAQVQCLKSRNFDREHEVSIQDYPKLSLQCQNAKISNEQVGSRLDTGTSTSKSIGVQTDKASNSTHLIENSDLSIRISNKLLAIWGSSSGQSSGRDLVSKLFLACSTDFHVLFGCLNVDVPSNIKMDFLEHGYSSDVGLQNHSQSVHSSDAGKVSHLYGVLTKIGNGMAQLDALFEALLSICNLENENGLCL